MMQRPGARSCSAAFAVATLAASLVLVAPPAAVAAPMCRSVDVSFTPGAPGLQIAVWVETVDGKFLDTLYVTRATAQFGLGNRPGTPLLKTDFRWPYGRREMVLPVWAHRRDHHYPKVVMGGVCGNSPSATCPDSSPCGGDCADSTIAYHSRVSSYEPYYCSPSGASKVDAMSCASKGTFAKGAFAPADEVSLYPPRADLTVFTAFDSPDARKFAGLDDLVAVSAATPAAGTAVQPMHWCPSGAVADGDFVLFVETSAEADWNAHHRYPNQPDTVTVWDFEGHPFLGQPSVVYRVPFRIDGKPFTGATADYAGYGSWDGQDGMIRPPDGTITVDQPGSGAGRLLLVGGKRLAVSVGGCGDGEMGCGSGGMAECAAPLPVESLAVEPSASALKIGWTQPTTGAAPAMYEVRYREGAAAIDDQSFSRALAPSDAAPAPDKPGARLVTTLRGLVNSTTYTVAVRGVALCGAASPVVSQTRATGDPRFTTLSGCFVATAAYGSPDDDSVATLRRLRDRHLLGNPLGRAFAALYYGTSPSVAPAIAADPRLRAAARALLAPLVALARAAQ